MDIITYEIESGDSDVLKSVENNAEINPSPETLKIIQDKFLQKTFLQNNKIPVPDFIEIDNIDRCHTRFGKIWVPCITKSSKRCI